MGLVTEDEISFVTCEIQGVAEGCGQRLDMGCAYQKKNPCKRLHFICELQLNECRNV
jgi:hypothetical protein